MASLVTIRLSFDRVEAMVAKSFLEAYGIFVLLPDWNHTTNAWHHTNALQGIRLCVMDVDARAAVQLLNSVEPIVPETFTYSKIEGFLAIVVLLLLGAPHPSRRRRVREYG